MEITKELIYCIGLWIAEGDSKTSSEITFTNNSLELVLFFREIISKVYSGLNEPRLYVYSSNGIKYFSEMKGFKKINYYKDERTNRPYYIYRLADVSFVKEWKVIVSKIINNEKYYSELLAGIFAGEGNIKHDVNNHNSRHVCISSKDKETNRLIKKILNIMEIPIKYDDNRCYWIHGRHLEKLDLENICILHPEKSHKFKKMIQSVKEMHYSPLEFKTIILKEMTEPKTTKELSKKFNRTELRVTEVLQELKKENKIDYIKSFRKVSWMKVGLKNKILIDKKIKILNSLEKNKSFTSIGKVINLSRKTIKKELEKEYQWEELQPQKT